MITFEAAMNLFIEKCKREYRTEIRKVNKAPCMEITKMEHRERLKAKLETQTEAAKAMQEIFNGTEKEH